VCLGSRSPRPHFSLSISIIFRGGSCGSFPLHVTEEEFEHLAGFLLHQGDKVELEGFENRAHTGDHPSQRNKQKGGFTREEIKASSQPGSLLV